MTNSLPLFENQMIAAPAIGDGWRRYFYRCADCLSVAASETKFADRYDEGFAAGPAADCDACGGRLEYMGVTAGAVVRRVVGYQSPCDDRCTHARGPECECPCGGVNHGSGVVVPIYSDSPIPRLAIPKRAAALGQYYRELCAEFERVWAEYHGIRQWTYRADYDAARKMRVYSLRNKAIEKMIKSMKGAA